MFLALNYQLKKAKRNYNMTDDQGYPELSMHGNPILKTPNLDELGKSSVQFKNFHVTPMCAPPWELLTGLDNAVNQLSNVSSGRALLKSGIPTMGNIFAGNGYSTGIFGKWHMGSNYLYRPQDRGFEESVCLPHHILVQFLTFGGMIILMMYIGIMENKI